MPVHLDFSKLDLMDALDLAILIEIEAYQRYKFFSEQLGHRLPGDAASIFRFMASNESKHGQKLNERREKLFGDQPSRVRKDDIIDVEAPEWGAPRRNMSPLKAFQLALASEEKAFGFFDEALQHVTDPSVRELFEELREEETEHIRMVKDAMEKLPPGSDVDLKDAEDDWR